MAPLPPREQRHPFLRYQGLEYSNQDIADFEERLERIHDRGTDRAQDIADFEERLERIHDRGTDRAQVLDFEGMPKLMRDVLYARMRMEHHDSNGVMLGGARRRMSWREFILALGLHTGEEMKSLSFASIAGRSQEHEKVTVTDLSYLRGLDVGSINIPYLLAWYLRRLLTEERLQGLTVTTYALPIDMTELVLLQIYVKFRETWAWVPAGHARQEGDAGGVAKEALVAPKGGDEDEEMPHAVPPPPRTYGERLARIEEDVHEIHGALGRQREVLDSMAHDFSRFKTGSKFSTIVREYVTEPSMLSKSRAELRRESVNKSVKAGRKV
nr:hypothetical protein [Tanacetum cinerariifolium]